MFDPVLNFVIMAIVTLMVISIVALYLRNLYFAVKGIREGKFSVKMVLRYVGVFVMLLGVVMGAIPNEKKVWSQS